MGKDAIRALSLANLLFLPVWPDIIDTAYSMPSRNTCAAIVINVLVLAVFLWAIVTLIRRFRHPLAQRLVRLAVPLALLSPLNSIMRIVAPTHRPVTELMTLGLVVIVVSLFEIAPWNRIISRASSFTLAVMFPFFLIAFSQVSMLLTHFSDKPLAPRVDSRNPMGPRVLWLLFDEMDEGLAFSNRPPGVRLPELDRFRTEAIYALEAYPPAGRTMISVPALLMGTLVSGAKPANPSELIITLADSGKAVRWGEQPTIFSAARSLRLNTALIGWYFPYTRILGDSLTVCSWYGDAGALTLRESIFDQIESVLNTNPVVSILGSAFGIMNDYTAEGKRDRLKHIDAYKGVLEGTKVVAVDPDIELIFAHFPVPHPPCIYDAERDNLVVNGPSSYLDNLQLVDRSFGELRRVMEEAGTWEGTVVLATSDHWWRPELYGGKPSENSNHRVPFIMKLAGQSQGITYRPEFNTVATQEMLIAILKGDISSPGGVVEWLDDHRITGNGTP
jgi:hypothetical protein